MKNMFVRGCTFLVFSLVLAGCNKPVAEPVAATDQPAAATAANGESASSAATQAALHGTNGLLTANPGSADCATPADVEFTWDTTSHPDAPNVEIWIGDAGPGAVIFASGGATGKQSTGPWVKPGTVFVMRNPANKQELDRITIGGDVCAPVVP